MAVLRSQSLRKELSGRLSIWQGANAFGGENMDKTHGSSENHLEMGIYSGDLMVIYLEVNIQKAIKNGHSNSWFSH